MRALAYGERLRTVRVATGARVTVTWPTDHGWYDVEVTAAEDAAFRRRLTGRVETRRATKTA